MVSLVHDALPDAWPSGSAERADVPCTHHVTNPPLPENFMRDTGDCPTMPGRANPAYGTRTEATLAKHGPVHVLISSGSTRTERTSRPARAGLIGPRHWRPPMISILSARNLLNCRSYPCRNPGVSCRRAWGHGTVGWLRRPESAIGTPALNPAYRNDNRSAWGTVPQAYEGVRS